MTWRDVTVIPIYLSVIEGMEDKADWIRRRYIEYSLG